MTARTNFSENNFNEILLKYDLGELSYFRPITNGAVQTNYMLITSKAKLVFKYYENRSKESVLFEINLINYLVDKKYPCPAPFILYSLQYKTL